MADYRFDDSRFPLIVVDVPTFATEAEFDTYLRRLGAYYDQGRRFALVLDVMGGSQTPANQRKKQAEFMRERAAQIEQLNVGTAFALSSSVVRGVLTAILWLQPMPCPHRVCGSREDALAWAVNRLLGLGVPGADGMSLG